MGYERVCPLRMFLKIGWNIQIKIQKKNLYYILWRALLDKTEKVSSNDTQMQCRCMWCIVITGYAWWIIMNHHESLWFMTCHIVSSCYDWQCMLLHKLSLVILGTVWSCPYIVSQYPYQSWVFLSANLGTPYAVTTETASVNCDEFLFIGICILTKYTYW